MLLSKKSVQSGRIGAFLLCTVVSLIVLIPIAAVVFGSLRTNGELLNAPFSWPQALHWENYGAILANIPGFWQTLLNSLLTVLGTVLVLLLTACPAAFILARVKFPGSELIFNVFLLGLLFPLTIAITPLYIMLLQMQLTDSLWGVILPQAAFQMPVTILILRNFFQAIPNELEDAAAIDGSSRAGFFWYIVLPLARPALAVVTMLAVVASWNNFLLPLLVLNDQTTWTLPLGVMGFQGEHGTDWVSVLAFLTLSMIPAIGIYLLAERQIVAGLTAGAVKG